MLKVILVSGYKRSGKDFCSNILNERIDGSQVMSFAKPLKLMMAETLDVSLEDLEKFKNDGCFLYNKYNVPIADYRSILQRFGTDVMQTWFGKNVWVNLFIEQLPKDGVVIVSDWRFSHEFVEVCKVADVITIRIDDFNLVGEGHISETALEDFNFDYRFNNTAKNSSILEQINAFFEKNEDLH